MQEVIEIMSFLNDEDKKNLAEFANILFQKTKYNSLRNEIETRRTEIMRGEVLSHKEIWQDI